MTRRVTVTWPDGAPFRLRGGQPIRILAASDEPDRTLENRRNREAIGPVDLVAGCGDLGPEELAFLGDAFGAPIVFVRGNHDRGGPWPRPPAIPVPASGLDRRSLRKVPLLALPWPTGDRERAVHDEGAAWRQVIGASARALVSRAPTIVLSHVPPLGVGDTPSDPYHRGFAAYRFLLDRLAPPLWLHGHTALAASTTWQVEHCGTTVVNVTGSVLVEIVPPPEA